VAALAAIVLAWLRFGPSLEVQRPRSGAEGTRDVTPVDPGQAGVLPPSASAPDVKTGSNASTASQARTEPPPSAVVSPLVATATLHRVRAGQTAMLTPGDRVAPGDGLFLEIRCPESAHAYVLNEDDQGSVYVLFPVEGVEPKNPLPPGRVHRLPGSRSGKSVQWQVTSVGGSETVIVLVARAPLSSLEREIAGFPPAQLDAPVSYHPVSSQGLATLRGIGGMTEAPSGTGPPRGRLAEVLSKLPAGSERDLWVWQTVLENRGE
jgi:hypothetical protein